MTEYLITVLIIACIYAIFSLGLNLQWGFTGLINFGHVAFMAIGAYATVLLSTHGVPLWLSVLGGIVMAGFFGFLLGIPTLRLREDFLAIVTIGFAEILRYFLLNEEWLTKGPMGLHGFPRPLDDLISHQYYNYFLLLLLILVLLAVYLLLSRLVDSPWGRVLKSIREDEDVASALGKNVFAFKVQSLMLGAAIAGLAGAFLAFYVQYIDPRSFLPMESFYAWIIVVLGGSANNKGTIMGALIFSFFLEGTRFIPDVLPLTTPQLAALRIMIIGALLIALMMYRPQGILGKKEELSLGR